MSLTQIIFPLPAGLKTQYEANPYNRGLFVDDTLVLTIFREEYNSPSNITSETEQSFGGGAISTETVDFYKPEIICTDNRSSTIRFVLEELRAVGNLSTQGINIPVIGCDRPHIVMFDYCYHDAIADQTRGYTIRVGQLNDIRQSNGGVRVAGAGNQNFGQGVTILFTHTHNIDTANNTLVSALP